MKKYTKPTIDVINLKSSENIAATFEGIRGKLINEYLTGSNDKNYTVSQYSLRASSLVDSTEANS